MTIKSRLSKLEKDARIGASDRQPGLSEEVMAEARLVAATCGCWQDLAAFLRSLQKTEGSAVISLADRERNRAATDAFARALFDDLRTSN